MRKYAAILIGALLIWGCSTEKPVEKVDILPTELVANADAGVSYANIEIEGMSCAIGCAKKIEKTIAKMEGVSDCKVDFDGKLATISFDEKKVNVDQFVASIQELHDGQYKVGQVKFQAASNESNSETEEIETEVEEADVETEEDNRTAQVVHPKAVNLPNIFDVITRFY